MQRFGFLLLGMAFLLVCCTNTQQQMDAAASAYYQTGTDADGQAYIAAIEEHMGSAELSTADQISTIGKLASVYFQQGGQAGLQTNFLRLLNDFSGDATADATARMVMDTVLYAIMDPETQRLVPAVAQEYIGLTETYGQARPDDPNSPERMFQAAEIARSVSAYQKALSLYSTIESYFPNYEKAPVALFMQGFVYSEDLKNTEEARRFYELFLEKHPEHEFVPSAQMMIENLGKTDEEIFEALEAKRKQLEQTEG